MIADWRLYDEDGHWRGVVNTTFGIVYNTDLVRLERLPVPTNWSDLAHPKYLGRVGMVDPSNSGSIRSTYEAILQQYGFEKGRRTQREVSANAR